MPARRSPRPPKAAPPRPRATPRRRASSRKPAALPPPATAFTPLPPAPPPPPVVPPAAKSPWRREVAFLLPIVAAILALNLLVEWLLRYPPFILVTDTIYFLTPPLVAALLVGGIRTQLRPRARLILALALGLLVALGLAAGRPVTSLTNRTFVNFFPVWAALVVPGPGRYRWTPLQMLGVGLILVPIWRSFYYSLPDLEAVFTPGGVAEAIPLIGLYRTFGLKTLREILFPVLGLYLLLRRFPWAQKLPSWRDDWSAVVHAIQAGLRRNVWRDLGWGAALLVISIPASLLLQDFLSQFRVLDTGDDSQVFSRITPDLVLLLALAAGVGEELLFRGVLQTLLVRSLSNLGRAAFPTALFVQALFFALVHAGYGNLLHVLLPFFFGLFMGLVFRYFGLLPAILIHVEIDIFAFGFDAQQNHPWVGVAASALFFANVAGGAFTVLYELVAEFQRRRARRATPDLE